MSRLRMVLARTSRAALLGAALFCAPSSGLAEADAHFARATLAARERGGVGDPITERRGELKAGEQTKLTLTLAPRQCVIAVAVVDSSVRDLELSLKTPEGLGLTDSDPGPVARLRYCAGSDAEKPTIRLSSTGRSEFAFGLWSVRTHGTSVSAAPVPEADAASAAAEPKPLTLPEQLAVHARETARDLEAMTPPREEELDVGDPRKRDVALEAERCYRVLAVASGELKEVTLSLSAPDGSPLAKETGAAPLSNLGGSGGICPKQTGLYSLAIEAHGGSGRVLWQIFGKPNPALASRWGVGGSADTLVGKRIRSMYELRESSKSTASPFFSGVLKTAEQSEITFDVKPGLCYVALAAGVPSLRSLDVEMLDQRGNVVASAKDQGSSARVSACADLNARWTVRVRAFKGYGDYGVQVFSGL